MPNDIADQIIQERTTVSQLRVLIEGMNWSHKIAVAQIACNQMSSGDYQLIELVPLDDDFDAQLEAVIELMSLLPPETLTEIAIEILKEPRDRNE